MVGSAIVRKLEQLGYRNIVTHPSTELDLRNQQQVFSFFEQEKPDYVFLAAAKVGGIYANNTYRGEFLYDNLMMNQISFMLRMSIKSRSCFSGSSCIYPRMAPQPLKESTCLPVFWNILTNLMPLPR